MKKLLIGILLGAFLTGIILGFYCNRKKRSVDESKQLETEEAELRDSFILTGDLIKDIEGREVIEISAPYFIKMEAGELISPEHPISSIKIFKQEGGLITRLDSERPVALSFKEWSEIIELDNENMGIELTDITGFHHTQTTIFSILKTENNYDIVPVCVDKSDKCSFYNTRGGLLVDDLDNDDILEVAEIHDEYPPEGGRGRAVLREVYRYDRNNNLFLTMAEEDYEKFYKIISKDYPEPLIRASESRGELYDSFEDYWQGVAEKAENKKYIRGD